MRTQSKVVDAQNGGQMLISRVTGAGAKGTTFGGGDGFTAVDFTSGQDFAWRLAVQSDGGIVATGRAASAGGRFAVARLTPTGALETGFSGDGKLTTNRTPGADEAHSVALDLDGNIVASGISNGASNAARLSVVPYLGS